MGPAFHVDFFFFKGHLHNDDQEDYTMVLWSFP